MSPEVTQTPPSEYQVSPTVRREASRMRSGERADFIRLQRATAYLREKGIDRTSWLVLEGTEDIGDIHLYFNGEGGFSRSGEGFRDVISFLALYKTDVVSVLSDFVPRYNPIDGNPELLKIVAKKPTGDELRRLPEYLAEDYRRKAASRIRGVVAENLEKGYVFDTIPDHIRIAQADAVIGGTISDQKEIHELLIKYHTLRRQKAVDQFPRIRDTYTTYGIVTAYINPVLEADNFLGEEHSPEVVEVSRKYLPLLQIELHKLVRPRSLFDFNRESFIKLSEAYQRMTDAAGVDAREEIEDLIKMAERFMRPLPRLVFDSVVERLAKRSLKGTGRKS